jgi:soluble lytic murein transglycosylase-like protein
MRQNRVMAVSVHRHARALLLVPLWLGTAVCGCAGEYAILANGARLQIDRHETDGAEVKLYMGAGSIEMKAADVQRFEAEDVVPKPAAPAAPIIPVAPQPSPQELADAAAKKYGLPPKLLRSVMKAESGFQPEAISPKGAVGLMQLMPSTAQMLGANPQNPEQNVDAGARYLRDLLEKFNGGLWHALAAYNAGPAAVQKYGGVPPFAETLHYIQRVEQDWKK